MSFLFLIASVAEILEMPQMKLAYRLMLDNLLLIKMKTKY